MQQASKSVTNVIMKWTTLEVACEHDLDETASYYCLKKLSILNPYKPARYIRSAGL